MKLPPPHFRFFLAVAISAAFPHALFAEIETVTYGNFEISYFGNGDTDTGVWTYRSSRDWTNDMKSGVERSVNYWNSVITTNSASKIKIAFIWDASLSSGVLGGAISGEYYNPKTGITLTATEAIWRDGISATEVSEETYSKYAATVVLSTTANFYYGSSAADIPFSQWDFQSMLTHEIGHAMGFVSYCDRTGWSEITRYDYSSWPYKTGRVLKASTFDTLLVTKDESGNYKHAISETSEKTALGSPKLEAAATYSTGTEYALELDESGTLSSLLIYNPSAFEDGSSMSHVYTKDSSDEWPLMNKGLRNGDIRRELLDEELRILSAMGWSVIPEPSAFGLLAGTLALVLVATRRRKKLKAYGLKLKVNPDFKL